MQILIVLFLVVTSMSRCLVFGHNWCCFNHCWPLLPMKGDMMDASQSRCRVSAHLACCCCRPQLADTLGANITTHLQYFCYLHYLSMYNSTSTQFAYIYLPNDPQSTFANNPGTVYSECGIILSVVCWCVQIINLFISGAGRGEAEVRRRLRAADSLVKLSRQLDSVEP